MRRIQKKRSKTPSYKHLHLRAKPENAPVKTNLINILSIVLVLIITNEAVSACRFLKIEVPPDMGNLIVMNQRIPWTTQDRCHLACQNIALSYPSCSFWMPEKVIYHRGVTNNVPMWSSAERKGLCVSSAACALCSKDLLNKRAVVMSLGLGWHG